jgi:hypothetical protein
VALQDRPDARGGDDDPHGGQFAVDAAVAPLGILLRQSEHHGRGPLRDSRSTWPAVRVGPALGDEIPVPAQQGGRLNEEVSETLAGEQSCQSGQHRPVRRLGRRSVHLASQHCYLVAQHDGEIGVTAEDESDQLEDAPERPREEREGHSRMLAAPGASRQSAGRRPRMAFSVDTRSSHPAPV